MKIQKKSHGFFNFPKYFDDEIQQSVFDLKLPNGALNGTTLPAVNIFENEDDFLIEMAVPGIKKENFSIELNNDILTVSAAAEKKNRLINGKKKRREFNYVKFQRTFRLSANVINDLPIEAVYEDGILEILIPKTEEIQSGKRRKITVS